LQIHQSSISDTEFTMVIYNVYTNIKLTCTLNISKLKKILNFQKCYLLGRSLKAEYIGRLRSLPQFHLYSNLDMDCSQMVYTTWTTIWVTCKI
jgi:hypothetical protein